MPAPQELGIPEDINHILKEGAALQTYRSGGGLAVARLTDKESSMLLGYGVDDSIELALHLACGSYAARELEYDDAIDLNHPSALYDDFRAPNYTTNTVPSTPLDSFINARTAICAEDDGGEIVAWTWQMGKEGGLRGATLEAATQALLIHSVKLH